MSLKVSLSKPQKYKAGQCTEEGHNERHHATASQLARQYWLNKKGHHVIVPWNKELADRVNAMPGRAKNSAGKTVRKDAVVLCSQSIGLGSAECWRDADGTPNLRKNGEKLSELVKTAQAYAEQRFGRENIVSAVVHYDEGQPHLQVVFAPLVNGDLNASHWFDGKPKMQQQHVDVFQFFKGRGHKVECAEIDGGKGGDPHDPTAGLTGKLRDLPYRWKAHKLEGRLQEAELRNAALAGKLRKSVRAERVAKSELATEQQVSAKLETTAKSYWAQIKELGAELKTALGKIASLEAVIEQLKAKLKTDTESAYQRGFSDAKTQAQSKGKASDKGFDLGR